MGWLWGLHRSLCAGFYRVGVPRHLQLCLSGSYGGRGEAEEPRAPQAIGTARSGSALLLLLAGPGQSAAFAAITNSWPEMRWRLQFLVPPAK